ncbi:hypothetical protein ACP275_08G024300 [Erythranthe tilingii]
MYLSNLKYQFPVHQIISLNINTIQLAVLIIGLIKFLLLRIILDRKRISHFFGKFKSHFLSSDSTLVITDNNFEQSAEKKRVVDHHEYDNDRIFCRGETEIVLRSLGMLIGNGGEEGGSKNIPARLDVFDIFEEERKPRLDEVKEAFDVFDYNKDGFIDANELQRILCALRLNEGSEIENCTRMIGAFDENGDGFIDFDEFVKFIEIS